MYTVWHLYIQFIHFYIYRKRNTSIMHIYLYKYNYIHLYFTCPWTVCHLLKFHPKTPVRSIVGNPTAIFPASWHQIGQSKVALAGRKTEGFQHDLVGGCWTTHLKNMRTSNWESFPQTNRGEHKKCLEPPPSDIGISSCFGIRDLFFSRNVLEYLGGYKNSDRFI